MWQENLGPDSVRVGGEADRIGGSVPFYFKTLSGKRGEHARGLWLHDDLRTKDRPQAASHRGSISVSSGVKVRRRCADVNANAMHIVPTRDRPSFYRFSSRILGAQLPCDRPSSRVIDPQHDEGVHFAP